MDRICKTENQSATFIKDKPSTLRECRGSSLTSTKIAAINTPFNIFLRFGSKLSPSTILTLHMNCQSTKRKKVNVNSCRASPTSSTLMPAVLELPSQFPEAAMADPAPCVMNEMASLKIKSLPSSRGEIWKNVWFRRGRYIWIRRARRRYSVAQTNIGDITIKE